MGALVITSAPIKHGFKEIDIIVSTCLTYIGDMYCFSRFLFSAILNIIKCKLLIRIKIESKMFGMKFTQNQSQKHAIFCAFHLNDTL